VLEIYKKKHILKRVGKERDVSLMQLNVSFSKVCCKYSPYLKFLTEIHILFYHFYYIKYMKGNKLIPHIFVIEGIWNQNQRFCVTELG